MKQKFLNASDINRAIDEVKQSGVRAALAGGAAMQIYGSDRLTLDVDFITPSGHSELSMLSPPGFALLEELSFGGWKTKSPSGISVDFIVRTDDYWQLYDQAFFESVELSEEGVTVRCVRPEHLAAMKMAAGRTKDEEDLRFLIRNNLDLPATRRIIQRTMGTYAAEDFDSYVDEVAWKTSQGK